MYRQLRSPPARHVEFVLVRENTRRLAHAVVRRLAWAWITLLGISAHAQTVGPRAPAAAADPGTTELSAPATAAPEPGSELSALAAAADVEPIPSDAPLDRRMLSLIDRFWSTLSQAEDTDGQINTDRPTFTPANTVVPRGRLQFESGFTYNYERTTQTHASLYDFPELAMRYGLFDRVELRTYWLGPTYAEGEPPTRPSGRINGGLSNMEVGFKWQLLPADENQKWRPTTALITSAYVQTGGNSLVESDTIEPYINLLYGWRLTEKLTLTGSTGYVGYRQQPPQGTRQTPFNYQRYNQSAVAFYSLGDRTTLFYEWYVLMFTNARDNRPTHYMDGGVIYHPTPNTQIDARAGFGLSGRPDDFFTGVGLSVRF